MKETRRIDYGDRRIIQDMLDARERLADIADAVCADPTSSPGRYGETGPRSGRPGGRGSGPSPATGSPRASSASTAGGVVELVYQYDEEDDFFFVFQGMTPPSGKSLRELELERREA